MVHHTISQLIKHPNIIILHYILVVNVVAVNHQAPVKCEISLWNRYKYYTFLYTVNARASSCLGASFAAKLSYQWQLDPSSNINLPNTIRPELIIPKQQLVGGRTYKATVRVSMQQDPTLAVTQVKFQSSLAFLHIRTKIDVIEFIAIDRIVIDEYMANKGTQSLCSIYFGICLPVQLTVLSRK